MTIPITKQEQVAKNLAKFNGVWDESCIDWDAIKYRVEFNANYFVKKYRMNYSDMEFAAWEGVAKAIKCFKPELGASFENYAIEHIKAQIRQAVYEFKSVVRMPTSKNGKIALDACGNNELDPNHRMFSSIAERADVERKEEEVILFAHLNAALSEMEPADRFLLESYYVKNLSYREIGENMGRSHENARNRVERARETLCKKFNMQVFNQSLQRTAVADVDPL